MINNSAAQIIIAEVTASPAEREAMRQLVVRRERFTVAHPEVSFSTHRGPDGALLHDISEPGRAGWATRDLAAALDDLEARYA